MQDWSTKLESSEGNQEQSVQTKHASTPSVASSRSYTSSSSSVRVWFVDEDEERIAAFVDTDRRCFVAASNSWLVLSFLSLSCLLVVIFLVINIVHFSGQSGEEATSYAVADGEVSVLRSFPPLRSSIDHVMPSMAPSVIAARPTSLTATIDQDQATFETGTTASPLVASMNLESIMPTTSPSSTIVPSLPPSSFSIVPEPTGLSTTTAINMFTKILPEEAPVPSSSDSPSWKNSTKTYSAEEEEEDEDEEETTKQKDDLFPRITNAPKTPVPTLAPIVPVTQTVSTASSNVSNHPLPPFPGKKGVAMTLRPKGRAGSWRQNLPRVTALKAYWNYRWGLERINAQPTNLEFVPMLWGGARSPPKLEALFKKEVKPFIEVGLTKRIMGFNEPDKEQQANMSVERALQIWPYLESLGVPLISPSCADPMGAWMKQFMKNATALCLRVDWVGVHWYGGVNFANFRRRMIRIYEEYRKPLVLTEFAPADYTAMKVSENRHTPHAVLNFAKRALPWLEATDWIVGYAWFPFDINRPQGTSSALFDVDGNLTKLGRYYASVNSTNPKGDYNI